MAMRVTCDALAVAKPIWMVGDNVNDTFDWHEHLLPAVVVLLVTASVVMVVWQGSTSFLPTFLHRTKAYSTVQAAYPFATLFGVGIVATPSAGYLGDRYGHLRTAIASTICGAAGIILLTLANTHLSVIGSIVLFAIGLTSFWTLLYSYLVGQFAQEQLGASFGILRTFFFAAGSLGPVLVGVVGETFGYVPSFWLLGGLLAVSALGLSCVCIM